MELVAVDAPILQPKNDGRMTTDEREQIGRKLRAMRLERGLKQADVANNPRADGLSLGTLQAIENAWYEVKDTNIEKYARFFGTSVSKLLKADEPKPLTPSDPLLEGLNEEHLEIARSYMRARKRVRAGIELLLTNHPEEERLTRLLQTLERLSADQLEQVDAWLSTDDLTRDLLDRVRAHLADPTYRTLTEEGLRLLDEKQPATTDQHKPQKKSTAPTRRA